MRAHGISGKPKTKFRVTTTDSNHDEAVAPNLLQRDFTAAAANQVWVGDITYLPTKAGWVYLAVLIDLYSRKVVGWALEQHMRAELCLSALNRAVALRSPRPGLIHHSDRGVQYACCVYQSRLEALQARQSMSRKGDCWDNAVAESFFGTLEQELVGEASWLDLYDARKAVSNYIHRFYNDSRRHSTLGQVSPSTFEINNQAA